MGSLNLHSNILIIITIIQSHHCWSPTATAQSVRVSACNHSIISISIIIILGHHCFVSPGFGLPITVSSSSLSFLILYSLLSVSGSRPALCSIDPSGYGCYQTDKIYNIIHSFTLVILSMHRKGSAKCALQFINFDIDTNKQYSEKVQSLKFVY